MLFHIASNKTVVGFETITVGKYAVFHGPHNASHTYRALIRQVEIKGYTFRILTYARALHFKAVVYEQKLEPTLCF